MKPQLDDETLQAFLDGELPPREAAFVQRAVRSSAGVAQRLAAIRRLASDTAEVLETLDAPLSPATVDAAERAVFEGPPTQAPLRRHWQGRAAAVVLLLAGGGALVLAAEPFRTWLASQSTDPEPSSETRGNLRSGSPSAPAREASGSGSAAVERTELGVEALDGRLDVSIETLRPGVRISVDVGDAGQPRAVVEAKALLQTGPGVIGLSRVQEPVFVTIPRDVAHATIRIDGRTHVQVRFGSVVLEVAPEQRHGDTLVFVSGPPGDR